MEGTSTTKDSGRNDLLPPLFLACAQMVSAASVRSLTEGRPEAYVSTARSTPLAPYHVMSGKPPARQTKCLHNPVYGHPHTLKIGRHQTIEIDRTLIETGPTTLKVFRTALGEDLKVVLTLPFLGHESHEGLVLFATRTMGRKIQNKATWHAYSTHDSHCQHHHQERYLHRQLTCPSRITGLVVPAACKRLAEFSSTSRSASTPTIRSLPGAPASLTRYSPQKACGFEVIAKTL